LIYNTGRFQNVCLMLTLCTNFSAKKSAAALHMVAPIINSLQRDARTAQDRSQPGTLLTNYALSEEYYRAFFINLIEGYFDQNYGRF